MQISFHKKNTTEAFITISIKEADYREHVAKKIKEYSQKTTLKGFRPGGVPSTLIQQMYGRSILIEAVNAVLTESLTQYLKENEIHVLGEPMPVSEKNEAIDWENQRDFEVEYMIGMPGEFSCALSKNIQVTAYKISHVATQTINDLVEQLRRTYGQIEKVDKSAADDVIYGELCYPVQDLTIQTEIAVGGVAQEMRTIFIDLSPQEKITFDVKQFFMQTARLPGVTEETYSAMLKLGGSAEFTVGRIHRVLPAVLAQEFFDKVLGQGVATSEQEFREALQTKFLQSKQEAADVHLEQTIQVVLLEKAAIALPNDFLTSWLQEKNNTVPKEEIAAYYPQYAKALRWGLLVAVLGKEPTLQVTQQEVKDEVHHRFQAALGSYATEQQLSEKSIAQLTHNFLQQENEHYKRMYEGVYMRKLIKLIKDQITILTQEISVEAFDQLVSR